MHMGHIKRGCKLDLKSDYGRIEMLLHT